MPGVTVFLPSVSCVDGPSLADRSREFPSLAWCLGAATAVSRAGALEADVIEACGLSSTSSLAALTAAHDLGDAAHTPDLLRSDPVHLHADPNKVLVYAPGHLQLSAAEADELLGALQREFPELGFQKGGDATRWYIRRPAGITGIAPSVDWLHGRSITPFMPLAATERAWRRWLNDLQMVLHEQPVNAARTQRGLPAINGVWWFGAGSRVAPPAGRPPRLFGNDVLLAGLARHVGADWSRCAPPRDALSAVRAGHEVVLVAGAAFGQAGADEAITLTTLDTEWLPALLSAVRRRRLARLTLVTATHRADIAWWPSLQAWRRPQSFAVE